MSLVAGSRGTVSTCLWFSDVASARDVFTGSMGVFLLTSLRFKPEACHAGFYHACLIRWILGNVRSQPDLAQLGVGQSVQIIKVSQAALPSLFISQLHSSAGDAPILSAAHCSFGATSQPCWLDSGCKSFEGQRCGDLPSTIVAGP